MYSQKKITKKIKNNENKQIQSKITKQTNTIKNNENKQIQSKIKNNEKKK